MTNHECSEFFLFENKPECNGSKVVMNNDDTEAQAEDQYEVPAEEKRDKDKATNWALDDNFDEFLNNLDLKNFWPLYFINYCRITQFLNPYRMYP